MNLRGEDTGSHIHTWYFDAETISCMLFPKESKEPYTPISDRPFFVDILEQVTKNAPSFTGTGTDEGPGSACRFLNYTVKTCRKALDASDANGVLPRQKRWFRNSESIFTDIEVEGSSGKDRNVNNVIPLLEIPRKDLVDRAANYARGLFRASRTRTWSLVLALNHEELVLQFLIFLRGGCSCIASQEIRLKEVEGRKGVCRMILTMLLWTEPGHAGFADVSVDGTETEHSGPSYRHVPLPPVEKPPTTPILLGDVGEPLIHVDSSWKICEAVIHALLGWLNFYEAGYLHRDVSINKVRCLKQPVESFKISIPTNNSRLEKKDALVDRGDVSRPETSNSQDAADIFKLLETARSSTSGYAERIKEAFLKLGVKDEYNTVLTDIDGDIAAKRIDSKMYIPSGTPEFMSFRLHIAMEDADPHLQSPVDDLHSFFWVVMWAVMFNANLKNVVRSKQEKHWQERLAGRACNRMAVPADMASHRHRSDHSPIFKQMVGVLLEWYRTIEKLASDWLEEVLAREPDEDPDNGWYPTHFHLYAYRGAAELLELMLKYQHTLIAYGSFSHTA
ncbi:hypothetical protein VNI00_012675 [Paramarasmius palmivorus]|uniref:Fungal-type protein kinase domain-containing protein n=1 Tax=Paramarasmius palmivorus TaxID=297713 RepID=A0AAW0C2G3_9AGAR